MLQRLFCSVWIALEQAFFWSFFRHVVGMCNGWHDGADENQLSLIFLVFFSNCAYCIHSQCSLTIIFCCCRANSYVLIYLGIAKHGNLHLQSLRVYRTQVEPFPYQLHSISYHLLVHSRTKLFWISPAYINHAISWRPQAGRGDCYAAIRPAEVSASGLRVMHVQAYLC